MYDIKINQFGIYQTSRASLLKPWKNNLSDPEAYPEPCQTSKMDCFVKIVIGLNLLTFFVRHSISDVWQGFKYTSVIYYLLIVWDNWGHIDANFWKSNAGETRIQRASQSITLKPLSGVQGQKTWKLLLFGPRIVLESLIWGPKSWMN